MISLSRLGSLAPLATSQGGVVPFWTEMADHADQNWRIDLSQSSGSGYVRML
jgi:hypothetical protein